MHATFRFLALHCKHAPCLRPSDLNLCIGVRSTWQTLILTCKLGRCLPATVFLRISVCPSVTKLPKVHAHNTACSSVDTSLGDGSGAGAPRV